MGESDTHRFIKQKVADALRERGYKVQTEQPVEEGRLDVRAEKDGELIQVEVIKSHIPQWILVKVKGDLHSDVKSNSIVSHVSYARKDSRSLKTVIPKRIAEALTIQHGDEVEWELVVEGEKIIAKVRKAKV